MPTKQRRRRAISPSKRARFIGFEKPGKQQHYYIRPATLAKYHMALETYSQLILYKKIFVVMDICRENGDFITKGEFAAILREKLDDSMPNRLQIDHLNHEIMRFRKWSGIIAPLIVYVKHERLNRPDFKGLEWIYRPLKDKDEYKSIENHIFRSQIGLDNRNKRNDTILKMKQKEIDARLKQIREEIDHEVQGL